MKKIILYLVLLVPTTLAVLIMLGFPVSMNRHVIRNIASEKSQFFLATEVKKKTKKVKLNPNKMKRFVFPVDQYTKSFTQKDMVQIVPTNIDPAQGAGSALNNIADRGVSYWLNSAEMKNSPLVKTTKEVQENLKTDIVVKGNKKNEIDHKFTMKYEAFQSLAKIEYQGWFKATVDYKPADQKTNVSIHEKVFKDKDLLLQQSFKNNETSGSIGLGWSW